MGLKIMVACGAGMGTSQIIKMKTMKVLQKLNIDTDEVQHTSVDEGISQAGNYDIVICSTHLANKFKASEKTKIVGVVNLVSEEEIEKKLREALNL